MMSYNINDYTPFREGNHPVFPSSENGCKHVGKISTVNLFGTSRSMERFSKARGKNGATFSCLTTNPHLRLPITLS